MKPRTAAFLSRAYRFKSVADYNDEVEPLPDDAKAEGAIATAGLFVALFARFVEPY